MKTVFSTCAFFNRLIGSWRVGPSPLAASNRTRGKTLSKIELIPLPPLTSAATLFYQIEIKGELFIWSSLIVKSFASKN